MKKLLQVLIWSFGLACCASAQAAPILLADYAVGFNQNPNESNYAPANVAAGFAVSNTSLAGGVANGSFVHFFHTTGWDSSQNLSKYVSFSVAHGSGDVSFDRIETILYNFSDNQTVAQPYLMAIRSSADGFANDIDGVRNNGNSGNHIPVSFDLSSLGVLSGATEFRVYYWNTGPTSTNPRWGGWSSASINGGNPAFSIFGELAQPQPQPQPVSEPDLLTLIAVGLLSLGLMHRRQSNAPTRA